MTRRNHTLATLEQDLIELLETHQGTDAPELAKKIIAAGYTPTSIRQMITQTEMADQMQITVAALRNIPKRDATFPAATFHGKLWRRDEFNDWLTERERVHVEGKRTGPKPKSLIRRIQQSEDEDRL